MRLSVRSVFLPGLLLIGAILIPRVSPAAELLEEIIERNYPIESTASFSLKNSDGSVLIYGADITEMKLQAIKKAYSRDRLGKINVDIAVKPDAVSINTAYPPKPKWGLRDRSGTVDYVIILPWNCNIQQVELGNGEMLIEGMRGNEVHAQLGSGRLFGHNCFTHLYLSLGNGGMDVAYDWWETHSIGLEAKVAEGNTRMFIPGDAQFQLRAESVSGNIFSDFTSKEDRTVHGQKNINLAVGSEPNATFNLRAVDGSIKITETYP